MRLRTGLLAAALCVVAAPALADAIDGDWCKDSANLHIQGPAIRTPGGKEIVGDYSRHAFHYVSPAGEKDAGADIMMRLLNEDTMDLMRRSGETDSPVETWNRCKPVS